MNFHLAVFFTRYLAQRFRARRRTVSELNFTLCLCRRVARGRAKIAPRTYDFYQRGVQRLRAFLGPRADSPIDELSKADLVAFRAARSAQVSSTSVNLDKRVARMLFLYGTHKLVERDNSLSGALLAAFAQLGGSVVLFAIPRHIGRADVPALACTIGDWRTGTRAAAGCCSY